MKTFIVDFVNTATPEDIQEFLTQYSLTQVKTFNNFDKVYLVSGEETPELADLQSPLVEHFINDSDHNISLLGQSTYVLPEITAPEISFEINDAKNWWKTYSCSKIDMSAEVAAIDRRGDKSTVYIMDSGIDDTHPEFSDVQLDKLFSIIPNTFTDTAGHGTAIASVISGKTCGLTNAKLKIVKIFDNTVATKQSDMLAAFDSILDDYLTEPNKLGIVNMSWSIPKNTYIESKILFLQSKGLLIVCSAGNNSSPIENVTPASMTSVLTIGAYNQDFDPCDFTNYTGGGPGVTSGTNNYGALDGWAPGIDIYSASPGGTYVNAAGTSMSAAIVSAALAYNLAHSVNNQGELYSYVSKFDFSSVPSISNFCLLRPLMILENQYVSSVNKIATFLNERNLTVSPYISFYFTKGQENSVRIFGRDIVKSVTVNDLPDGLRMENNWLLGNPTVDLGTDLYRMYNITFTVTLVDDTTDEISLDLAILSENFDNSAVPVDDPILSITLAAPQCTGSACSPLVCGTVGCINFSAPKGLNCGCAF